MAAEFFAGLGALKSAFDLARGLKDLNDAAARNAVAVELGEKLLTAQHAQSTLLERVSGLEKEMTRLKAWDAEKERYQLTEVSPGVFAYTVKPGMEAGEPFHMLCANCYQHNEKSLLQATQEHRKARRVHRCPRCQAEFEMGMIERPQTPVNRGPAGGSWGASRLR